MNTDVMPSIFHANTKSVIIWRCETQQPLINLLIINGIVMSMKMKMRLQDRYSENFLSSERDRELKLLMFLS